MNLEFIICTNKRMPMINGALFQNTDGDIMFIDRDATIYSTKELEDSTYTMSMLWKRCYVWDGENETYINRAFDKDLIFIGFDLEDDAGEDYIVRAIECWFDDGQKSSECYIKET